MSTHLESGEPQDVSVVISQLTELATDLHWTWNHGGDRFWHDIGGDVWTQTRNPFVVLQNLSSRRLRTLCERGDFRAELARLVDAMERYKSQPRWGDEVFGNRLADDPQTSADSTHTPAQVAYFSMEFGLGAALPLYAGGLGILAGDYLKAASDLGIPLVGVTLMYHEGYFRQSFDSFGQQQEIFAYLDSRNLPISPYTPAEDGWLRIAIEFPGRRVYFRVWEARVGRVRLYLLDSNDPLNSPRDQGITSRLYGGSREERLMQQIALGVGGWRLIEALPDPIRLLHLNEGHAAFATIERARHYMENHGISFWEALWATRGSNLFTTHTPLPAAFDTYPTHMLANYSSAYAPELHVTPEELAGLGRGNADDHNEDFNMAYLAMRTCGQANAVSELHGRVSRHILRHLYPRWPEAEVPVGHVTNGVHLPSWDSPWSDRIWTQVCGKGRWMGLDTDLGEAIAGVDDATLWGGRGEERADLIEYVRKRLAHQMGVQGADASAIRRAAAALDSNVLTLGFARRFTAYKRPNLLLSDEDRLARLLTAPERPAQIIIAGKAHPDDDHGRSLLQHWIRFSRRPDVAGHVVFLHDYDTALAQELVQGVDLWLNTPLRPWEACGTSGMKVLVNGGLNLSTLDGWWAEAYRPEYGWAIGPDVHTDIDQDIRTGVAAGQSDAADAEALYALLENEVIPEFYDRDASGIPRRWVNRIRRSMTDLVPRFSANRMAREYTEHYYLASLAEHDARNSHAAARARQQNAWIRRLHAHWPHLHWGNVEVSRERSPQLSVQAYLGDIEPDDIVVQLYADATAEHPRFCRDMRRGAPVPGAKNGFTYHIPLPQHRPESDFTPRLIPNPELARVPAECHLIRWWEGARISLDGAPAAVS